MVMSPLSPLTCGHVLHTAPSQDCVSILTCLWEKGTVSAILHANVMQTLATCVPLDVVGHKLMFVCHPDVQGEVG